MNKIIAIALSIAAILVWSGIASADDVLVCGAPRALDASVGQGSHVQECKVIHVTGKPRVREPRSFTFGGGK
jgi:hypothetical protein